MKQDTRIFGAEVGRQLCIGVFARYGSGDSGLPAVVHRAAVVGTRAEKIGRLRQMRPSGPVWATCGVGWQAPFLPVSNQTWEDYPSMKDLMPWSSRGITTGRTWVYAPDPAVLRHRWERLLEAGKEQRRQFFVESRDRRLDSQVAPLPGYPPRERSLADEEDPPPEPIPVSYRSFDRQWLIPDSCLMVRPRPPLWAVRSQSQVYVTEQSNHAIDSGPALTFTALIPDIDHYNARSGRVFPLFRDADARSPNFSPGLLRLMSERLSRRLTAYEFLAYIAAVVGHGGYTSLFHRELATPGVRVPLTSDPVLWRNAAKVGGEVLWLHTFGEEFVDERAGRPRGTGHLVERHGPRVIAPIPDSLERMPDAISYDPARQVLNVGEGQVARVSQRVYEYDVGGMRVVRHWFNYRSRNPRHKRRSSLLDDDNCQSWTPAMTDELLSLLAILARCVALEPHQTDILAKICSGPLVTTADLADASVLPAPQSATRPPIVADRAAPPLF